MNFGAFNYYQIQFTLSTFKTPEDKIGYLYKIKVEINRVIKCFTRKKYLALGRYGDDNLFIEDNCPELKEFVKKKLKYYNSTPNESRFPGEHVLKRHLQEEVTEYHKLIDIIDSEIAHLIVERDNKGNGVQSEDAKKINNLSNNKNSESEKMEILTPNEQAEIEKQIASGKQHTSIRELREEKKKITWRGSESDLIQFFDHLYEHQIINVSGYDEIFSMISHYFVDEQGNPFRVEKSVSAKTNFNSPKLPKGYQRYMNIIEKLKTKDS